MVKRRKIYKGGNGQESAGVTLGLLPGNNNNPNTVYSANKYSDAHIIAGRGCAGTKSNISAANSEYVPYSAMQTGGGGGVCLSQQPLMGLTGPRAGYAGVQRCAPNVRVNQMSLGAGGVSSVGRHATLRAWPGKGGRRRTKRQVRHRVGVSRKRKKHKSLRKYKNINLRKKRRKTRRRRQRGGRQPYSNVPITFGYGLGAPLPDNSSALATPPPQHVYNHCEKNNFNL